MKERKNEYPKKLKSGWVYAKYPVKVSGALLGVLKEKKHPGVSDLKLGQWLPAEVMTDGSFRVPDKVIVFDNEASCVKACILHNTPNGWDFPFMLDLIRKSVNKAERHANEKKH